MATYTGSTPGSSTLPSYQAQQLQAWTNALLQIQNQRAGIANQAGIGMGVDANGMTTIGSWNGDTTSGYGQLLQGQGMQNEADKAAFAPAATGFRGGGISRQAAEAAQRMSNSNVGGYIQSLQQQATGLDDQTLQAGIDYYSGAPSAQLAAIQQAIASGTFNPGMLTPPSTPTTPSTPGNIWRGFKPPAARR